MIKDFLNHFEDGTQNYLVFETKYKCFKKIGSTYNISQWKSKGLYNEIIKTPENVLAPKLKYTGKRMYVKFNGSSLKQDKTTFNHEKIVNIYIVYESTLNYNADITLENCIFGAVEITKNADVSKYKYFEYGIGFDGKRSFFTPEWYFW